MTLENKSQVANTLEKLAQLEARYEILRNDASGNQRLRELSMTSLKRLINQFKEEVARFKAGAANGNGRNRELHNETELARARNKLQSLEAIYEEIRQQQGVRQVELESMMQLINQLKEEIARYEAHHVLQR
jgi:uncharacterized small protein (DUF1192 family)